MKLLYKMVNSALRSRFLLKCFLVLAILTMLFGLYLVYLSPEDYLQQEYVKIMYVHVPAAWLALLLYTTSMLFSIMFLVSKTPTYHVISYSLVPVGTIYSAIALVTGAIWGKPTWGTWWVWDARLTSMLFLFFTYVSVMMIYNIAKENKRAFIVSCFILVGFINIPIIKFSVELLNTLHQPSSFLSFSKPSIHPDMMKPLFAMFLSFGLFAASAVMMIANGMISIAKIKRRLN